MTPESLFAVLASLLCTASLSVLATSGYWSKPTVVAPAVMVDLAVGLPALGYVCLVRTRRAEPLVLIPLFVLGALLARWWIPEAHRLASEPIKVFVAVVEALLLLVLAVRARTIRRIYSREKDRRPYPSEAMEMALSEVLGRRLGAAIFGEGAALWYGFAGWGSVRSRHSDAVAFPDHDRSGYPAILGVLVLLILIETTALHLLIGLWSQRIAWVMSGLGAYTIIWLLGDFNAARHRPTLVSDFGLHLRSGLRWRVDVPWSAIRAVRSDSPEEKALRLTRFGPPSLWVEFETPRTVRGLLGIRRQTKVVGLGLDRPDEFRRIVADRLTTSPAGEGSESVRR